MRAILNTHTHLWLVLSSGLMHLLCCGLPLGLSLLSLTSVFGTQSSELLHSGWLGRHEMEIYVLSGAILLITGLAQYTAYRINCRKDGDCHHAPCEPKKHTARWVFGIALTLYAVNTLALLLSH